MSTVPMRALLSRFVQATMPSGPAAGWLAVCLLALGPLSAAAQKNKPAEKTRIANVALGTGRTPSGSLLEARSDTVILYYGTGSSGTTLVAAGTVQSVCTSASKATVSGFITVSDSGEFATKDLTLVVRVQYKPKKGGKYTDIAGATQTIIPATQLMPGQTEQYPYQITFTPIPGASYRVIAKVTITDHAGYMGVPYGPETSTDFPSGPYPACTSVPDVGATAATMEALPARLAVSIEADRLEALSGETVPFSASLENTSDVAVSSPVARVILPVGLAYVAGSVTGADSVHASGSTVDVYLPGTLAAGARAGFRFQVAVLGTGNANLDVRVIANALNSAASPVASASVRMQRNRATETRAIIGKVWLDADANGRQDDGEEGVVDVEVWTADGNIATTDSTGKFSFPEVRLGTHLLRIDPSTLGPEYRVAESVRNGVTVTVDGWTTPRVLLPVSSRAADVTALRVAVRPMLLDPGFCSWAGEQFGKPGVKASGCGELQVAAGEIVPPSRSPEVDVTLARSDSSEEVSYRVPDGWELVRDGFRVPASGRVRTVRDRLGHDWVVSKVDPKRHSATVRLRPIPPAIREPVRVPPVRTEVPPEERARRAIITGPPIRIFEPVDGRVFGTDRIYVGVKAEPNAVVTLFDGDQVITRESARIDGQLDFVNVKVAAGPHVLRVRMTNTWNVEQWDSVRVHVSGAPASIAAERDAMSIPADRKAVTPVRVRVLDTWGVPVVNQPFVTVRAGELEVLAKDDDASSVGLQLRADSLGWVEFTFAPPREVGRDRIELASGDAASEIALDFFTPSRPLIVVGNAQLGLGSTRRSEGAMTVRGNINEKTSLTVSVDSRGRDPSNPRFGGETNPLSDGVLPISGDAGDHRTVSSYDSRVSLRLEQGQHFASFGDMRIGTALNGLTLLRHERSLRGVTGMFRAGGIQWSGFGALTNQSLRHVQLRGEGTSGPFELGSRVLAGTEQIDIEVRDPENAQNVLNRQRLTPYVDYEIDYERGVLLLKQPLAATDMNANPLFLMVSYEGQGAGQQRGVFGFRARRNLLERTVGGRVSDSVSTGVTYVRDDQIAAGGLQLFGTDVRAALGKALGLRAEVVYAKRPDSSGYATSVEGTYKPWGNRVSFDARWSSTTREYRNPADLSLVPATSDMRVGATANVRGGQLRLDHSAQNFGAQGFGRERTTMTLMQPIAAGLELETRMSDDRTLGGPNGQRSGLSDTKLAWRVGSRAQVWGEIRRVLWSSGADQPWGDHIGGGASLTVLKDLALEARHLRVAASDSIHYSLTEIGLRTNLSQGSRAWGSYQITGGLSGASNAAVVGLNNRFSLARDWTLNTLFERRTGVQRASGNDPVRAAPLSQTENDYWSSGLGLELAPKAAAYHASLKGEMKNGTRESSRLFSVAGDVSVSRSVALLVRQDYSMRRWSGNESIDRSGRNASILGLAVRPATSEAFNGLFQFRWLEDANPVGGGIMNRRGKEQRVLASAEAIWSPVSRLEVAGRCAARGTVGLALDSLPALRSRAVFCGGRYDIGLTRNIVLRGESRLLREQIGRQQRWDMAPSLLFRLSSGIEVGAGYRVGDLQDPDFANGSRNGWFVTLGARASEGMTTSLVEYWRERLGRD